MTDHDVDLLTRKIDGLAATVATLAAAVGTLSTRMDERFDQIDKRFEQVDQRFEQVDQRFEQIDRRFEQVDRAFGDVTQELVVQRGYTDSAFVTLTTAMNDGFAKITHRLDRAIEIHGALLEDHARRITILERRRGGPDG